MTGFYPIIYFALDSYQNIKFDMFKCSKPFGHALKRAQGRACFKSPFEAPKLWKGRSVGLTLCQVSWEVLMLKCLKEIGMLVAMWSQNLYWLLYIRSSSRHYSSTLVVLLPLRLVTSGKRWLSESRFGNTLPREKSSTSSTHFFCFLSLSWYYCNTDFHATIHHRSSAIPWSINPAWP